MTPFDILQDIPVRHSVCSDNKRHWVTLGGRIAHYSATLGASRQMSHHAQFSYPVAVTGRLRGLGWWFRGWVVCFVVCVLSKGLQVSYFGFPRRLAVGGYTGVLGFDV